MVGENKNIPELRFQGFSGAWEKRKLEDLGKIIRISIDPQATPGAKFNEYSMPAYDEGKKANIVLGKTMQSSRLKISGDVLLINKLNVRQRRIWLLRNISGNAVASSEFMPFVSNMLNLEFLEHMMLSDRTTLAMESISSGTSNSQKRITPSDFLSYVISVPADAHEQAKIGRMFTEIDNLIAVNQRKLNTLKKLKKSYLQKMFPQNGSEFPELRFAGFTTPWEKRKLGDLAGQTYGGGTPKTNVNRYWEGNIPWIQSSNLNNDDVQNIKINKFISDDAIQDSAVKLVPADSIAIVTRVGVGKLALVHQSFATSQDFLSLSHLNTDTQFSLYAIYKMMKKEASQTQGTSIKGITKNVLTNKILLVPHNLAEQAKVGSFFKSLDNRITVNQRKLDALKKLKQGYLQKMFC